jgi:predicted transposase YbfD/YdcC
MSSSPTSPAPTSSTASLIQALAQVPDPRHRRGRRHPLTGIIAAAVCAVIAGSRSFAAIAQWAADLPAADLHRLGLTRPDAPDEATFRRVLSRLDATVLDALIGAYLWTRTSTLDGRRVIALDGKTVRGARHAGQTAPHLVAALDHATGVVVGQLAVAAKSNEIPAVRTLLETFDLHGVVVTVDAMHTQTDTADLILKAGGDYVLTVKANQPTLYAACKDLPWKKIRSHSSVQTGHGRRARRTIKVVTAPAWITFAAAAQVAQIRRTVTRPHPKKPGKTKKTIETVYVITSADHHAAPPDVLASWVQNHWSIENQLHWVRDVTFDEDRSQVRTGHGPQSMATLRNTALSLLRLTGTTNIAAALRHHAADRQRALKLALTS